MKLNHQSHLTNLLLNLGRVNDFISRYNCKHMCMLENAFYTINADKDGTAAIIHEWWFHWCSPLNSPLQLWLIMCLTEIAQHVHPSFEWWVVSLHLSTSSFPLSPPPFSCRLVYFYGQKCFKLINGKDVVWFIPVSMAIAHITGSHKRQEVNMEREWDPMWWMDVIAVTANNFALSLISPGIDKGRKTRWINFGNRILSLPLSDLEYCAAMASFLWHRNHCRWDIIFSTLD